jgi:hypothetical protein
MTATSLAEHKVRGETAANSVAAALASVDHFPSGLADLFRMKWRRNDALHATKTCRLTKAGGRL